MSAIRLARAATGRDIIVKCIGCYHGHVDGLLVQAGSGAFTLGTPSRPGVPKSVTAATAAVHYNSLEDAAAVFEKYPGQIACFAVEPVAGNMGVVPPAPGYLEGLRALRPPRRAAAIRRSDDRLPRRAGRRVGTTSAPTSRAWARSSAAAFHCPPTAGRSGSWKWSVRRAPSTRPAPSAAIRWPWPAGSRRWRSSRSRKPTSDWNARRRCWPTGSSRPPLPPGCPSRSTASARCSRLSS